MDDIEKRLAALEAKVEEMAARRRKFVAEEEKEAAEIAAAIEYYQRTGRAPEGFHDGGPWPIHCPVAPPSP
jgi:hypothetical protein